jgi:Heterokaryon incompatibility protein (HET)
MGNCHSSEQDPYVVANVSVQPKSHSEARPVPASRARVTKVAVPTKAAASTANPRHEVIQASSQANMPTWLHLLRISGTSAEGQEQHDATNDRLERHMKAGRPPVTTWERLCLDKAYANNRNQPSSHLQPSSFDELRISGFQNSQNQDVPAFRAEECRACASRYTFRTRNATATIVLGNPKGINYKAISYVWGMTHDVVIRCNCGQEKWVPIASPERFCRLLALAATAKPSCEGVWLDALSIDQDSHSDKNVLLGSMGDIYKSAESVLVLFTEADQELFQIVTALRDNALIQDSFHQLDERKSGQSAPEALDAFQLQTLNTFVAQINILREKLNTGTYFQRAWTMQEWALGRELDITCEDMQPSGPLTLLHGVKSAIIRAAVRLAIYVRTEGRHSGVSLRGANVATFVDCVKELFPNEDVFRTREEVNWKERVIDGMLPFTGLHNELGLRLEGKILCATPLPSLM